MKKALWLWIVGCLIAVIIGFLGYWRYEYAIHSTPQKAQTLIDPAVGPFETVKFAKGEILFTPSSQGGAFDAWYVTKNFWGWHASEVSQSPMSLAPQNYNVDFESVPEDGQTLIWGSVMTPIKKIIYHHDGKTYIVEVGKFPVWHMILPFKEQTFLNEEWEYGAPKWEDGTTV